MKKVFLVMAIAFVSLVSFSNTAQAQECMLGEIRMFSGSYAPVGWAFCDGSLVEITRNTALYSVIGINYGGDGYQTFALPDLRNAVPVGAALNRSVGAPGKEGLELGRVVNVSGNSTELNGVAIHYIICVQGLYPTRQ